MEFEYQLQQKDLNKLNDIIEDRVRIIKTRKNIILWNKQFKKFLNKVYCKYKL